MIFKKLLLFLVLIFLVSTYIENVSAQSISPCDTNPNGAECGLYLKDEMNAAYQKYINALQTGDSTKINAAFQNYKAANDAYCQNLLSRGVTTTCNAPLASTTTASATATTPAPQITTPKPVVTTARPTSVKITSSAADYDTYTTGYISINSAPYGAGIWIDGDYYRETPTIVMGLMPGIHTVTIRKESYKDYSETVAVKAGRTTNVFANLEPLSPIGDIVPILMGLGGAAAVVAVVKGIGGAIAGAKAAGAAGSGATGAKMPPRPLPPPPKTPQRLPAQPPRQAPEKRPLPPPPKAPPPREAPPRERPAKKDIDKGDRTSSKERVQLTSSDKEELKNILKNLPSEDILNEYKDLVKSEEWDKMTTEQRKQVQQVIFESYTEQYQGEAAWDEFTEKLFNDISKEQQKETPEPKTAQKKEFMTCGNCGNTLAKGEKYCSKCGAQAIWIDLSPG